jgi:hypothetical protein
MIRPIVGPLIGEALPDFATRGVLYGIRRLDTYYHPIDNFVSTRCFPTKVLRTLRCAERRVFLLIY